MSELNFVFGFGFLIAVGFAFFLGEHPEYRPVNRDPGSPHIASFLPEEEVIATITAESHALLKTNRAAVRIIRTFEGLSLDAYPEADTWLIGYGHKGNEVAAGMSISTKAAERYLRKDLETREDFIRSVVTVSLNENEFSALVILAYNIGNGSFRNSTVLRLLNDGDRAGAANAFVMWNKVKRDGKLTESTQLTQRREAERALFLT